MGIMHSEFWHFCAAVPSTLIATRVAKPPYECSSVRESPMTLSLLTRLLHVTKSFSRSRNCKSYAYQQGFFASRRSITDRSIDCELND
jgi:hypothetical protein